MALTFGGATSDRVDCGSGGSIDTLNPWSLLLWVFPTNLTGSQVIAGKGIAVGNTRRITLVLSGTSGDVVTAADRATSDLNYTTNSTPLSATNSWIFMAVTLNTAGSANNLVNIYKGTLSARAAECTYASTTDGSGALQSDAAETLFLGNNSGLAASFKGRIAVVALVSAELSLGQIIDWQFNPRKIANTVGFWWLGFNGTGTQPDWSGNGNAGTVTGATVGADVPLSPSFHREQEIYYPTAERSTSTSMGIQLALAPSGMTTVSQTATLGIELALAPSATTVVSTTSTLGIELALAPSGHTSVSQTATPGIELALAPAGYTDAFATATLGIELFLDLVEFSEVSTTATLGIELGLVVVAHTSVASTATLGIELALAPSASVIAYATATLGIELALAPTATAEAFATATLGIELALFVVGSQDGSVTVVDEMLLVGFATGRFLISS